MATARPRTARARVRPDAVAALYDVAPGSSLTGTEEVALHAIGPGRIVEEKEPTLREIRRVLKARGTLHLLDFGGDESPRWSFVTGWPHGSHRLRDNFGGAIQRRLRQAGFAEVQRVSQGAILFGHLPIAL
jgi:hypothetical protein